MPAKDHQILQRNGLRPYFVNVVFVKISGIDDSVSFEDINNEGDTC